jgi:microcystin-dependent protein
MPISENEALFQLIGPTYGGDGQSTFALPDLRGRSPIHQGQGPGLGKSFILAETGGVEEVTLTVNQIPAHSHPAVGSTKAGVTADPAEGVWAAWGDNLYGDADQLVAMNPSAIEPTGGSQPHNNMPPYLAVHFIISLFGIFPSPS